MLNILTRLASFQRHVCGVYQAPVYLLEIQESQWKDLSAQCLSACLSRFLCNYLCKWSEPSRRYNKVIS